VLGKVREVFKSRRKRTFLISRARLSPIDMSVRQRKQSVSGTLVETVKQAEKRVESALLVLWDDLPSWQQDNHYIHSGYRPASGSLSKSFASLGYLHNESVNIYSHLLGAVIFTLIAVVLYTQIRPRYDSASSGDVVAFSCFFLGAAMCLGMSATYHATSNHSQHVARLGNKLDYVGIVFLITGSFIPSIYYGFYCQPRLQKTYWTMVSGIRSVGFDHAFTELIWEVRFVLSVWAVLLSPFLISSGLLHGGPIERPCL
jgi:adiponectin receptor